MSNDEDEPIVDAPDPAQWSNNCPVCMDETAFEDIRCLPCGCQNSKLCVRCVAGCLAWFVRKRV